MSDPLAAEVVPAREEPVFVTYLTFRASEPIIAADLDLLLVELLEDDAEACLQMPADAKASFVVSLRSMAAGYYEAAVERASLLLGAASALGIDAHLIEVHVYSDEGQAHFDRSELVGGLES